MRKSINPYPGPKGPSGPEFNTRTSKIRPRAQIRTQTRTSIPQPRGNNRINPNNRQGITRSIPPRSTPTQLLFVTAAPIIVQFFNNVAKCSGDKPVCEGVAGFSNPTDTISTGPSGTTWPWIRKQNCSEFGTGGNNACAYAFKPGTTGGLANTIFPPIGTPPVYPSVVDPYSAGVSTNCTDAPYCDYANFVVTYENVDPTQLTDADMAIFQANGAFPGYMIIPPPNSITTLGSNTTYQPSQIDSLNTFILPNLCAQPTTLNCPTDLNGDVMPVCSKFLSGDETYQPCKDYYQLLNQQPASIYNSYIDGGTSSYCDAYPNNEDCTCLNRSSNQVYQQAAALVPEGDGCWYIPCKNMNNFLAPSNFVNDTNCPDCITVCSAIIQQGGANANGIVNNQSIGCTGCNGWVNPCTGPSGCTGATGPCACANNCIGFLNPDNTCNCSGCTGGTGPVGSCTGPNGCSGVYNSSGICICSSPESFWSKYKYYIIGGIVIFIILIIILVSVFAYRKKKKTEEEEMRAKRNVRMKKIA